MSLIVAEYVCPVHGRFEETLERDTNGDAPDSIPCGAVDGEAICPLEAPWTISAPKTKVWSVTPTAAVRGGDMKDRPPGMLDTRPLAEGMPMSEWKKKQTHARRVRRHKQLIDKGLIQRKVIVG